ncbi:PucR family transcriptional regulator [Amorphoplanes nipponensis]|uniref:Fis family transcriptional regulator n=1 Tax=Actinoplanes nipponensis TaxID=135950 RepID=A0A919MKU8_9ACTN|nr:helix-turn-helix domain-containing protein [Actinoplanes nipponensis]GIE48876.1 Fis family transcriptional regulator [Actinoplanes nipponensis]
MLEPRVAELPAEVGERLRAERPALRDRVLGTMRAAMSGQGRSLTGGQGRGLTLGVETAVEAFVRAVAEPAHDPDGTREVFVELGRTEFREGHSVDALRSILTLGGRAIWAYLVERDLPPAVLYVLASALFGFIDALAGAAAEGYLDEQRRHARDWDTTRRRLITLLVQPDPPGAAAILAAADAARWRLPGSVAVVSVEGTDGEHLARRAGSGTIATVIDDATRLILPEPATPGRVAHLAAALAGQRAALGPAVALDQARLSYRLSRRALQLQRAGVLPSAALLPCDEHLVTLIHAWEPGLAGRLAGRWLAPLEALGAAEREVLAATLLAWLRAQGQVLAAAAALPAHPQTVRYRMRKIRRLFGAALDDPDARLALQLALTHRAAGTLAHGPGSLDDGRRGAATG